jgi:hypothetical protein
MSYCLVIDIHNAKFTYEFLNNMHKKNFKNKRLQQLTQNLSELEAILT